MYDNPQGLIAGSVIMWVVTTLCVGMRFSQKLRDRQRFFASDWLIVAAWIFGTGLTILEIYGVAIKSLGYKIGAAILDPTAITGQLNKAKHIQLAFLLLGIAGIDLVKLSVCFLYWQLFAKAHTKLRRFLIVWITLIALWGTSFVLAGLLECGSHLTAVFGTPTEYLKHCGSAVPSGYAMVATDFAADFVTLIIPIPVVLGLHIDTRKKILTLLIFLIGALSVASSITKGYIYIRSSMGMYTEDALIILTGISMWNLAEVQIGIIAACGPLLRPVLIRAFSPLTTLIASKWRSSSQVARHPKENQELPSHSDMPGSEVDLAKQSTLSEAKAGAQ
ncbi:hypothetical protein DHEL01_v205499 [Diaporthe helianthi]|uniref:Rhodopsin domain-containing protein n=1 Tax=Diaporthe helianthi TaxID=158607 RepID=A0A2P5I0V1_DIAHE|nr:hypothetical protein DHEL01_v205499 [Diaporthe helianthi]